MHKISVIINTVDRGEFLKVTLDALRYQRFGNFEIIVVNGPSTDNTNEVLDSWKGKIKTGECKTRNLATSRNIGLSLAVGDIVAYLDDDAIPEPEWLADLSRPFDDPEIGAVGGLVLDINGWAPSFIYGHFNRLGRWIGNIKQSSSHFFFPYSFEAPYPQGCNMAFPRRLLLEIGGFDENFAYLLEEPDVCCRIMDKGYKFIQLNNGIVHHIKAGSQIRRKGIYTDFYQIFKSKAYFSYKHAKNFLSLKKIDRDNDDYFQSNIINSLDNYNKGLITKQELDQIKSDAKKALQDGKTAVEQHPKYIRPHPDGTSYPFLPFPVFPDEKKLTIVFLCEEYPPRLNGGNARHTHDKAHSLAQRGHEVHVICQGETENSVKYEDGVWVHRMHIMHQDIPAEYASLRIPQCLWNQSCTYKNEIEKIGANRKIDIIEAPIWNLTNLAVMLEKKYFVLTCLVTTLGLSYEMHPEMMEDTIFYNDFVKPVIDLENHVLTNSSHLISISRDISEKLLAGNEKALNNVSFSPLGLQDWWNENLLAPKTDNKIKILFVGRLEKRKGIKNFLEALELIPDLHEKISIDIVGDYSIPWDNGKTAKELFKNPYEKKFGGFIKFHGKVDENSLHKFYANCDIFVSPSLYESFGLVNVEAMLCGKPIISTRVGGIPEVVREKENCILVPPDSSAELARAMACMINDPPMIERMGNASRNIYEKNFTPSVMAENAEKIYYRILGNE